MFRTHPSGQALVGVVVGSGVDSEAVVGLAEDEGVLLELSAAVDTATSVTSTTVMPREPSAELRFSGVTELATDSASSAATVTAVSTSTEKLSSLLRVGWGVVVVATSTTDTMLTSDSVAFNASATPAV